jgi:MarR family transcriptional regulator, transcriptional regulator for hemolysin
MGLYVTRRSRALTRAFEKVLAEAGGSLPTWLVLASLKGGLPGKQAELAEAVGIEGPTLTHHLNRLEAAGLVTRARHPENRRVHIVALTAQGEQMFANLLTRVRAFDEALRAGFRADELTTLHDLLGRLVDNATAASGGHRDPVEAR